MRFRGKVEPTEHKAKMMSFQRAAVFGPAINRGATPKQIRPLIFTTGRKLV